MMRVGRRLGFAAALIAWSARGVCADPAAHPVPSPPAQIDRPLSGLRLSVAFGEGLVAPAPCGSCDRFWGAGWAYDFEIGWTFRPNLVLSFVAAPIVIHFSDGTDGLLSTFDLAALYLFHPGWWLRGALGVAQNEMVEDSGSPVVYGAALWSHVGADLRFALVHDIHRHKSFSTYVEARTTLALITRAVTSASALLVGVAWN